ncbi:CMP-sialic acid transporter isoform X2 [Leuresthes tenuis]|uniref:CMP-sialic acid transporter isoform X2 n=1 Tax=Leuresthes tenuis TaxID=355514 RepID=UPI003B50CC57
MARSRSRVTKFVATWTDTKQSEDGRETGSLVRLKDVIEEHIFFSPKELLKLSVPSIVYAVQNNMAFVALSNLDAAVYQVTYQLKIPCTALCTVLMLNRSLSRLQWFSVFMLCGGVTLVQWKPVEVTKVQIEQNPFIGFIAVAVAVLCSGFAGVYFEKVLKSSDTSLWVRNIQMYLSGIVVTLIGVYMNDGDKVLEKGFFFGYTPWVCFVVFLASVGGLYTSVVVKYTDNIMKGFSAAAAIILSTVASVLLFGLQITITFASGAILVCISIYLYGLPKQDTSKLSRQDTESKQKLMTV